MLKNFKNEVNVVHSMSETRWSARSKKPLTLNYFELCQTLKDILLSERQSPTTIHEAKSLDKKLYNFEMLLMCIVWNDVLQKTNIVNQSLQTPGIELCRVVKLYDCLLINFQQMREEFNYYEEKTKEIGHTDIFSYSELTTINHSRKKMYNDGEAHEFEASVRDKFKFQTFYVMMDTLIVEIKKRNEAYIKINERFSFLTNDKLTTSDIKIKASNLEEIYLFDLEKDFVEEFIAFVNFREPAMTVSYMLQKQIENKLTTRFPNINIAFRIYLAIFGTSCESERYFLVLKRIKNFQRSTISQGKLSSLSLLSIESELLREIRKDNTIDEFANTKCRKS